MLVDVAETESVIAVYVNEFESSKQQRYAITDPQFGTSLTRYPYQSAVLVSIRILKEGCSKIADRRLLIAVHLFRLVQTCCDRYTERGLTVSQVC
jgi:hypothetical protein